MHILYVTSVKRLVLSLFRVHQALIKRRIAPRVSVEKQKYQSWSDWAVNLDLARTTDDRSLPCGIQFEISFKIKFIDCSDEPISDAFEKTGGEPTKRSESEVAIIADNCLNCSHVVVASRMKVGMTCRNRRNFKCRIRDFCFRWRVLPSSGQF